MRTGTIKNGFVYSYDETLGDDMRFVDQLVRAMDTEATIPQQLVALVKVIDMLLGKDQRERLYEHIAKDHGGRVPVEVFRECFGEIMAGEDSSLKN